MSTQHEELLEARARSLRGTVELRRVAGRTAVTRCHGPAPIKLLTPDRGGQAAWVYMSSYGGGLVAGDLLDLHVDVGRHAVGVLTTQASTKVYHQQDGRGARQRLTAAVARDGVLVVAPDPVTCYANARYDQRQSFDLEPGGSLLMLDWFTAGRLAMGERWGFDRYTTENLVRVDGRVIARDRLGMDRSTHALDGQYATGRYNCFATVMLIGPAFDAAADLLDDAVRRLSLRQRDPLPISFSRMPWGGVLRLAGMGAEPVRDELARRLTFVEPVLGSGLWLRKW